MRDESFSALSPGHTNSIATTLTILDEALCEFEQWAQGREIKSVFYREENQLQPDQRDAIKNQVARIREKLLELKDGLQLEGSHRSVAQSIWSQCSMLWVNLIQVTSKHLRGYGEVPAAVAEYLDPRVAELIDLTKEISSLIKKR
jgi:hypothetical protein